MPWIDLSACFGRRPLRHSLRTSLLFAVASLHAQMAPIPGAAAGAKPSLPFAIVIDAAHGGADTGVHLNEQLEEKDLVLALSVQLRSTLSAHGIHVTTTREMDVNLSALRRAEIANHQAAGACILLHATASGYGVHLFTSSLAPVAPGKFLPWDTAQAAFVQASLRLSAELNSALTHAEIPVTLGRTFLLPMDNLACPTVAIEIAPLGRTRKEGQPVPLTDPAYQKQIVSALTAALEEWKQDTGKQAEWQQDEQATGNRRP